MTTRIETIGDATLYLGDCRDVLPALDEIDVTIADPPYGVAGGWGSGLRKGGGKIKSRAQKSSYDTDAFTDDREHILSVVIPMLSMCVEKWGRAAITPGLRHMWEYPRPDHVGTFQYPGSTTMSCWGPMLWQAILFYGRDPHQGRLRPDSLPQCNGSDLETDHPCPKPIKQWSWLVERASVAGEVVLDPFMGSGTTGVACATLGRGFVGVELVPRYFDTACRRIEAAYKQPRLFAEPEIKPVQESMF